MFITISKDVTANRGVFGAESYLVKFSNYHTCTTSNPSGVRWLSSRKDPKQGAFTGTISAHDSDPLPLTHAQGNIT